jgi:isopenicillin N synthase-like dioxygenase
MSMQNSTDLIPIVDLADYRAGEHGAREAAAQAITRALETSGFFGIRNHGVDDTIIAAGFVASAAFHALPLEEKLALQINSGHRGYMPMADQHRAEAEHANLSASFLCGVELAADDPAVVEGRPLHSVNQWPDGLPGFRDAMTAYHAAFSSVGMLLVDLFEAALEVDAGYLSNCFEEPMAFIRALHYPPAPDNLPDGQFGAAPHSDFGFVTILAQDDVGGLQVEAPDGAWIDAPNLPGVLLINIGDMLMRWTNDRFRSTVHRVINADGVERYSMPFFFDPVFDTVVACIDSCCGPGNPPRYPPTSWGEFLNERFNANHKYRQAASA